MSTKWVVTVGPADERLTAMGLLAEVYGGLAAKLAPQIAEHGLSDTEFEVVLRLARTPAGQLRMTDLAAQTNLSTSGITRVVDRLEKQGLVARESCTSDRRGYWATLTPAGRTRVEQTLVGHLELIERWLTGLLTPEQLHSLTATLRILRDAVRPGAVAGAEEAGHPVGADAPRAQSVGLGAAAPS